MITDEFKAIHSLCRRKSRKPRAVIGDVGAMVGNAANANGYKQAAVKIIWVSAKLYSSQLKRPVKLPVPPARALFR